MRGLLVDGGPVDRRRRRATTSRSSSTGPRSTPRPAARSPTQGLIVGDGVELEVLDVQRPVKGLIVHTVKVASGEVGAGVARHERRSTSSAVAAPPGAHRHAHGARGAAPGARPERRCRRLVQQARLPAPRLRAGTSALYAGDAQRDRGGRQPRGPRRPAGRHAQYMTLAEATDARRDGAVRRDVRRRGPGRRDRRALVARAVRRHARVERAPRSA